MLSEDEIKLSYAWLKTDLFKRIICKDYPDAINIEVDNFSVKAALGPGENYASTMIRATVNYFIDGQKVEKYFVIKAGHYKKEVRELLVEMKLFEREIVMFRDIIPKVEQLLADIGDNSKLAAKCYELSDNPDDPYLIFEDLSSRGYKNVDRRLGLDVPHFKKSLSKIAKWHAANAVLLELTNYKDYPEFLEYEHFMISKEATNFMTNSITAAERLTKEMPGFEHLSGKIANSFSNMFSKIDYLTKDNGQSFMTLCHGDLWMNNVMYCHDEDGLPTDAILCDYQIPARTPAILDVINHLYLSTNDNVQDREWDIVIQHYHKELATTLTQLNYPKKIPTLIDIQIEFLEKGVCYATGAIFCPGVRFLENTGEDVTTFIGDGEKLQEKNYQMISNPKCRKTFEFLLDFCDRKGYFEN